MAPQVVVALALTSVLGFVLATAASSQQNGVDENHRRLTRLFDPKTVKKKKNLRKNGKNRRKFVSYSSSKWEQMWLKNADFWAEGRMICGVLKSDQKEFVHDFLNLTCTSRYHPPFENWCIIDDDWRPLWYNTANRDTFELSWENPLADEHTAQVDEPSAVIPGPEHEHIVSKFVFFDEEANEEYVEYIEPLVSHLRFPLAKCIDSVPDKPEYKHHYTTFRGYVIPPPGIRNDNALYFDAGASSWEKGSGGPSLK